MAIQRTINNNREGFQKEERVVVPTLPPDVVSYIVQYLDLLGLQLMVKVSHVWRQECLIYAKKLLLYPLNDLLSSLFPNLEQFDHESNREREISALDHLLAIKQKAELFKAKILMKMRTLSPEEFEKLRQKATQNLQIVALLNEYETQLELEKRVEAAHNGLVRLMHIRQ